MSELFRELQEDMRAERTTQLWQRFGKSMVWVSVAVVAGTAAGVLWKDYRASEAMKDTNRLIKGVAEYNAGDFKNSIATLDELAKDRTAQGALAMLHKAEAQKAAGDKEGAEKTLAALAAESKKDTAAFASLARMKTGTSDAAISKDTPFYYSLSESKGWALIEQEKKDEAIAIFDTLYHDEKTPQSMKQRLLLALQHLAPEKLNDRK